MNSQDIIALFGSGVLQSGRLMTLNTLLGPNQLVPHIAVGKSRLGRNFEFVLDVVSLKDSIALKTLIAQPVTLWTQQADESYLPHHGYIHTARRLGSDGQLTTYQLAFSSWLHFLKFRKDARIFQDMTAQDIIAAVFQEHPQAAGAYRFDERNAAPARSFCVQFEDDWNFVHRLLESEGWYYYFEHADDGKSHTLVVTDDLYSLKPLAAEQVEFYRAGISSQTDALVQWAGTRTLQSTSRSTQTFDYSSRTPGKSNLFRPSTIRASCRNKLRSTNTPALTPISTTRAATN